MRMKRTNWTCLFEMGTFKSLSKRNRKIIDFGWLFRAHVRDFPSVYKLDLLIVKSIACPCSLIQFELKYCSFVSQTVNLWRSLLETLFNLECS